MRIVSSPGAADDAQLGLSTTADLCQAVLQLPNDRRLATPAIAASCEWAYCTLSSQRLLDGELLIVSVPGVLQLLLQVCLVHGRIGSLPPGPLLLDHALHVLRRVHIPACGCSSAAMLELT